MPWWPLDVSRSTDSKFPALLISATFRPDSYSVHLTDLSHIWSESLDRREIFRRSQDESTTIDPRDGDQLHVLLEKIKFGLEGGEGTSLTVTINDYAGRPGITLSTAVPLPGGLAQLEWPIHLTPAPQSILTNQLTIPLLEEQQTRMRELASLDDILQAKDHVIQKLIDKLESQGMQLGQVFPQAAGKAGRNIDRKKANEKVKGLGPFDMEAWRQGLGREGPQNVAQLVRQVFKNDRAPNLDINSTSHAVNGEETWWERLKGETFDLSTGNATLQGQSKTNEDQRTTKSIPKRQESVQHDEQFQVQATPPHLASKTAQKPAANQTVDDSTDDDDDLDAPSQRSNIRDSFPSSPPPAKSPAKARQKLGQVGGKKEPPKPASQDDDETTEGSVSPPVGKSHSPEKKTASPEPEPVVTKPKRTLGRIERKVTPKEPEPEAAQPTTAVKEPAKPSRGRLGQIGGKRKEATPALVDSKTGAETIVSPQKTTASREKEEKFGDLADLSSKKPVEGQSGGAGSEEPRGRGVKQEQVKEPRPRETSEERANRKREKLKTELLEKAKAPVKKKRKF